MRAPSGVNRPPGRCGHCVTAWLPNSSARPAPL